MNNQESIYEIYAKHVGQDEFYGFVEVADLIFGNHSGLLVDPAQERLKNEFAGVSRTLLPIQTVLRIDEVDKEGTAKIQDPDSNKSNITKFPMMYNPEPNKKT